MRNYSLTLLALLLLLPMAGCSTDSNLGGLTPSCIEFEPEVAAGNDVVVTEWLSDCDVVELAFYYRPSAETPNVWSAEFEIHFPFGIVIPDEVAGTTFPFVLDDGGEPVESILGSDVQAVAQLVAPGIVEFGITRVGDLDGVMPTAGENNLLGTFAFGRVATQGSGTVSLIDGTIRSKAAGDAPVAIDSVTFLGGEFDIN